MGLLACRNRRPAAAIRDSGAETSPDDQARLDEHVRLARRRGTRAHDAAGLPHQQLEHAGRDALGQLLHAREADGLDRRIYDTYAGMILPLLVDAAGVFIMKNFFESIPASVEEQARIDGAGVFRTFWSVVLPMARPAVITIIILSFQGSWNELSHFIVSTQSPELTTLTKGVASLASGQLSQGTQYPLKLAAALIMTIPVAVMFFIFQRRIMNASEGAVKE